MTPTDATTVKPRDPSGYSSLSLNAPNDLGIPEIDEAIAEYVDIKRQHGEATNVIARTERRLKDAMQRGDDEDARARALMAGEADPGPLTTDGLKKELADARGKVAVLKRAAGLAREDVYARINEHTGEIASNHRQRVATAAAKAAKAITQAREQLEAVNDGRGVLGWLDDPTVSYRNARNAHSVAIQTGADALDCASFLASVETTLESLS